MIYVDTLDENGNVIPDSMRFFEMTATTPEELQKEIERITETVRNELGNSDELTPSSVIRELEQLVESTDRRALTPGKTVADTAAYKDSELENKEPYVTSGNSSTEAGVNQINEELKAKPESPKVDVTVNVPESTNAVEKIIEKTNTVTESLPGEKITTVKSGLVNEKDKVNKDTPSSVIAKEAEKEKAENVKSEPVVIKTQPSIPTEQQKEKGDNRPITSLTKEQAIIKYNIEHGLNPDGSVKIDKTNPENSSPVASTVAAASEKEVPQDNIVKVIQSSDDRYKLTNYQETQGTTFLEKKAKEPVNDFSQKIIQPIDKGGAISYITTPSAVVKTAAEPPAKTQEELNREDDLALLLELNKLREIGWLSKIEPTKPSETGTEVEKKEDRKTSDSSEPVDPVKSLGSTPITTDLVKNPEPNKKDEKVDRITRDPSVGKKDLLTKIIEERDKRKHQLEATIKTASVVPQSKTSEKSETVEKSPEVKVKTSEKIVTPELARGIMQNTPESKGLAAVNDALARVQSSLLTIGQTQVTNANNTSTINNSTSNVKNEDNRQILQEERKLEKEKEKTDEKNIVKHPNQLTEFYLHGIYDALVSQGIKIKSY